MGPAGVQQHCRVKWPSMDLSDSEWPTCWSCRVPVNQRAGCSCRHQVDSAGLATQDVTATMACGHEQAARPAHATAQHNLQQ